MAVGFIMDNTTNTRLGIVNTAVIIMMAVARKFAALTVHNGNTDITESVRLMFTTTDIDINAATVIGVGFNGTRNARGEVPKNQRRIPSLEGVVAGIPTIGDPCHVTGTLVHRHQVRRRRRQVRRHQRKSRQETRCGERD